LLLERGAIWPIADDMNLVVESMVGHRSQKILDSLELVQARDDQNSTCPLGGRTPGPGGDGGFAEGTYPIRNHRDRNIWRLFMNLALEMVGNSGHRVSVADEPSPGWEQHLMVEPKAIRIVTRHVGAASGQHVRYFRYSPQAIADRPGRKDEVGMVDVIRAAPGQTAAQEQAAHDEREHLPSV